MNTTGKISPESRERQSLDLSTELRNQLSSYVTPLVQQLYLQMDRRLVSTFVSLLEAIIRQRHNTHGLVLTELGGELLSEDRAPAGTKRIGKLLKSEGWEASQVDDFITEQGQQAYADQLEKSGSALVIWDESVVEKPESIKSEGLCAVRSSKAKRLVRIRRGYYNLPTKKPVHVPGFHWIGLLIAGLNKGVWVYKFKWWTTRGDEAQNREDILTQWVQIAHEQLSKAIHVFDRGFCGSPWLGRMFMANLVFVLRWKPNVKLLDSQGVEQKAGQIGKRLRSKSRRQIWDAHKERFFDAGMCFTPVKHPDYEQQLFLVICRPGKGRKPWYLLTNLPIHNDRDAWQVIFIYARRWQIETAFRFNKSELAIQSPRNKKWAYRLKLMALTTLVYVFLLALNLNEDLKESKVLLFRLWCHRTGRKYRKTKIPIYRLRLALAKLWARFGEIIKFNPEFLLLQNSG